MINLPYYTLSFEDDNLYVQQTSKNICMRNHGGPHEKLGFTFRLWVLFLVQKFRKWGIASKFQ